MAGSDPACGLRIGQCEWCNEPFTTKSTRKRYCSDACQRRAHSAAGTKVEAICIGCGIGFHPKRTDRTKFCSRDCAFGTRAREAARRPQPPERRCIRCGERGVSPRHRICPACADAANAPRARQPTKRMSASCSGCGVVIEGTAAKRFCARCNRARAKEASRVSGAKAAYRKARKALQRGVTVETVNPLIVLKRDRWTCQLCGEKTPKKLRGTFADRAPEVDHIVPLAAGGEHSYRNVQCACRQCNIEKSGKVLGQMRLF